MNNKNGQSAAKQILVKPIKGWEDLYTISSDGKVFSIRTGKYLKPRLSMDGYERVALCRGRNYRREYRVHRLVAEAFIENPNNLPQVNHKDFNVKNNCLENLEWVTNKENAEYSINAGREGFGNKRTNRSSATGRFIDYKAYTFTNVYNNESFTIIGIKNVLKQFGCPKKTFLANVVKYANTGAYVKQGLFKGLKIDSEYLKVQRLVDNDVLSSERKCGTSQADEDIV
jgi:hypothetical protein